MSEHEELNKLRQFVRNYIPSDARGEENPLDPLFEFLQSPYEKVRLETIASIQGLIHKGLNPAQVMPILLKTLQDEDKKIREEVAWTLGIIGEKVDDPRPVISALLATVLNEDWWVRATAAEALGKLGPRLEDPAPVVAALVASAQDEAWQLRKMAVKALGELGSQLEDPATVVATLQAGLKDKRKPIRETAAEALGELGSQLEDPAPVVVALLAVLEEEARDVQKMAEKALRALTDKLKDPVFAVPVLLTALKDKNRDGRRIVEKTLKVMIRHLENPEHLISTLLAVVKNENDEIREMVVRALGGVAWALGKIGSQLEDPAPVVSAILDTLKDKELKYKDIERFIEIVNNLESFSQIVPTLQEALKDKNVWIRAMAAQALAVRADEVEDLNPVVTMLLEEVEKTDDHDEVDPRVITALVTIVPCVKDPSAVVPALHKVMYTEGEEYVRWDVVKALGVIGPKVQNPSEVADLLLEVIFEPDEDVSDEIKGEAIEGLFNLVEGLGDPSPIIPTLAEAFSLDGDFEAIEEYGWCQEYYPYAGLALDLFRAIVEKLEDPMPVVAPLLWLLDAGYADVSWSSVRGEMIGSLHADIRWTVAETLEALCWRVADPSVLVNPLISFFYFEHKGEWPAAWLLAVVVCRLSGFTPPVPVLRELLADVKVKEKKEKGEVWGAEVCGWILSQLEDPVAVLPTLRKHLKGHEETLAAILGEVGRCLEDPTFFVPLLLQLLAKEDADVRCAAAMALGKLRPKLHDPSPLALPLLQAVLAVGAADDDAWEEMIKVLVEVIGALENPAPVVEALLAAVQDENEGMRYTAVLTFKELADLIENPTPVVVVLVDALKSNNLWMRRAAAEALDDIGSQLENLAPVVSALLDKLTDENASVRATAARSLDKLGWKPQIATEQAHYLIAKQAWDEVSRIGAPAIAPLIQTLADDEWLFPTRAANALKKIGEPAVDALIRVLQAADREVRRRAAWTLGEIGDEKAVEPLTQALTDKNQDVQRAAREALVKIKTKSR
ncbi:MAG: HEAT repeat domain-containing protein [Candidatus Heimdallarchaeota archaeon]